MSLPQSVGALTRQFVDQAYLLATLDFFRASAWIVILLVP